MALSELICALHRKAAIFALCATAEKCKNPRYVSHRGFKKVWSDKSASLWDNRSLSCCLGLYSSPEAQGAQTPLSNNPLPLPSPVWGMQACFSGEGRHACLDQNDLRGPFRPDHRIGAVVKPAHTHTKKKEHKHAMSARPQASKQLDGSLE